MSKTSKKVEPFSYTSTKRLLQMYGNLKTVVTLGDPTPAQTAKFEEIKMLLSDRKVKLP